MSKLDEVATELMKYNKLLVALAGAAVAILGNHVGVDSVYYLDAVVLLTALGVYVTPNKK